MIEISEYESAVMHESCVLDDPESKDDDHDCVFCEADVGWPNDMSRHLEECPYQTGVWVVGESIWRWVCEGCDEEHIVQYMCPRCERYFEDGDPYRIIEEDTGLVVPWVEHPGVGTAICMECAQRQTDALMARLA